MKLILQLVIRFHFTTLNGGKCLPKSIDFRETQKTKSYLELNQNIVEVDVKAAYLRYAAIYYIILEVLNIKCCKPRRRHLLQHS